MPPLSKRAKFPALTQEQVATLVAWIAQETPAQAAATLQAQGK